MNEGTNEKEECIRKRSVHPLRNTYHDDQLFLAMNKIEMHGFRGS